MSQAATMPHRVPETMSAAEIGAYMAQLRGQFKLSPQDVSERLHIRARYVYAIEEGKYDQMPGKAYARGYVHTYAEFLGLDPEQIVNQCFAGELPSVATAPLRKPVSTVEARPLPWRGIGIAGAVALMAVAIFSLFSEDASAPATKVATVAPVPETMLDSVRTNLMPSPQNIDCLTKNVMLSCFFADKTVREIMDFEQPEHIMFAGKLNLPAPVEPVAVSDAAPHDE